MRSPTSNRGSVLVAALILSAIIAISLSSYLALTITAYRLSQRSFFSNGAMNLVDTGFEQALWSQDYSNWTGAGFNQRSGYTTQWQGTFPSATTYYQFKQGVKGQVKVWLDTTNMPAHAVSRAIITMGDGTTLIKQAEIYLQKKSYFTNGLVAKNQITFSGNNAMVDSWNSDPDNNPATAPVPYSSSVAHDNGSVGSLSVNVDSISVSNADIYGYAAIGGSSLSGISVGPNGLVGPYGTANGTIDTSHVTYDFTTSFPDATVPTTTYSIGTINTNGTAVTLPRAGDVPNSDGTYYYSVPSISLSGNGGSLVISGSLVGVAHPNVVVVVTNTNGTVVSSTGQSGISIDSGASLSMYTSGDVSLAGNGVMNGTNANPNQPKAFELYGTRTSAQAASGGQQSISISGNGILSGIVYAPNANITMTGGGNNGIILGAMVGNNISVTGNSTFHYDESLANLNNSNIWGVTKWRELASASDRATYNDQLNF